jgi:dihydroxyacetone kinase-like protein
MKKILNEPSAYVEDMLAGLCAAYPEHYRLASARVLARTGGARQGKVGIVTGGGSGHLPVFLGYVGQGLLDACAVGNVFAGPRVADCIGAIEAANGGAGVLTLYGNYGGDRMNFEMAQEQLESDRLAIASVRVADDVASASPAERDKRRGVAGMVLAFKAAGACAAAGHDLGNVTRVARKAAQACRSIGVALTPCTIPESGQASFEIADAETMTKGRCRYTGFGNGMPGPGFRRIFASLVVAVGFFAGSDDFRESTRDQVDKVRRFVRDLVGESEDGGRGRPLSVLDQPAAVFLKVSL